jgi:hypothetical protein
MRDRTVRNLGYGLAVLLLIFGTIAAVLGASDILPASLVAAGGLVNLGTIVWYGRRE